MALPPFLVKAQDVEVVQGPDGIIGRGSLGEVRRGTLRGVEVALKSLFMLRTDAASIAAFGGALSDRERQFLASKFMKECMIMQSAVHPNIVPFFGVVVDDTPQMEPLFLAMHRTWRGPARCTT